MRAAVAAVEIELSTVHMPKIHSNNKRSIGMRSTRLRLGPRLMWYIRTLLLAVALLAGGIYLWSVAFPIQMPQPNLEGHFVTSFMRYRGIEHTHRSEWLPMEEIPQVLICAVVKAEDRGFFAHRGIDWRSVSKALLNWVNGRELIGASTISQQLARNLFLTPERSVERKLRELWYTFRTEQRLTKRELLETYLNAIEWGAGIWGIKRASRHYFGTTPKELGLEASLFLASKIANPLAAPQGDELTRMEAVYLRVNGQLFRSGLITDAQREAARAAWSRYRESLAHGVPTPDLSSLFPPLRPTAQEPSLAGDCGFTRELAYE